MSGSFGLDYYSFPLRRAGHIVAATGDTLLEGEVARLLLYRLGGRRNLRGSDRWNPYLEGGVGLGAANAPFATSDSTVYGGAGGVLVGSLFVGTGVRTNGRGPIGGFGALRLDGVHSLLWGQWGLVVSARVGLTVDWNSMTGLSRRSESPQVWTEARSLPRTYHHLKLWAGFWDRTGTLGRGGTLTVTADSLEYASGRRRFVLATKQIEWVSFSRNPAVIEVRYLDEGRPRQVKFLKTARLPWKGHERMELLEASIQEAIERSHRKP